jgi:hypothetical protein
LDFGVSIARARRFGTRLNLQKTRLNLAKAAEPCECG